MEVGSRATSSASKPSPSLSSLTFTPAPVGVAVAPSKSRMEDRHSPSADEERGDRRRSHGEGAGVSVVCVGGSRGKESGVGMVRGWPQSIVWGRRCHSHRDKVSGIIGGGHEVLGEKI